MNDTLHGQVDLLKVQLANALRTVGNEMLPTVTDAVKNMNTALESVDWDQFRSDVKATVDVMASLVSITGKTASAILSLRNAFKFIEEGEDSFWNWRGKDPRVGMTGDTSSGAFRELDSLGRQPVASATPTTTPTATPTASPRAGEQEFREARKAAAKQYKQFSFAGTITPTVLSLLQDGSPRR